MFFVIFFFCEIFLDNYLRIWMLEDGFGRFLTVLDALKVFFEAFGCF